MKTLVQRLFFTWLLLFVGCSEKPYSNILNIQAKSNIESWHLSLLEMYYKDEFYGLIVYDNFHFGRSSFVNSTLIGESINGLDLEYSHLCNYPVDEIFFIDFRIWSKNNKSHVVLIPRIDCHKIIIDSDVIEVKFPFIFVILENEILDMSDHSTIVGAMESGSEIRSYFLEILAWQEKL